jgi:hypothetical protein
VSAAYRKGVRLSITIAPKASAMLDELLATGLFGRSRAEVAQRFVYAGLRDPGNNEVLATVAARSRPRSVGKKRKDS